jgi:hypothetical protein
MLQLFQKLGIKRVEGVPFPSHDTIIGGGWCGGRMTHVVRTASRERESEREKEREIRTERHTPRRRGDVVVTYNIRQ